MSTFSVKVILKDGRLSAARICIDGTYTETSLYFNGSRVYNNRKYTKLFIYKLPDNNLSIKDMYKDFSPLKLYEGRWVIGCIEDMGSSSTSVWAYSDKKQESDSLDCSELEWREHVEHNPIKVTLL
tara:strand:+ start:326 stop:703 length:378 start_codon:yes stop_codon:yes gene_type:complete